MAADQRELAEVRAAMSALAASVTLPIRSQVWRGGVGRSLGQGSGSSLEFQDHRLYHPGDDPRHVDWRAFGRTDQLIMKQYREEVRPKVDIVCDISSSMSFTAEKRRRVLELFCLCAESALQLDVSLRAWCVRGEEVHELSGEQLFARTNEMLHPATVHATTSGAAGEPPNFRNIRWRFGSLRVFISDLLFKGDPSAWLIALRANSGNGIVLVPFLPSEVDPPWRGNVLLVDVERGTTRPQRTTDELMARYRVGYERHFTAWREDSSSYGVRLARVSTEGGVAAAIRDEALRSGAFELCNS